MSTGWCQCGRRLTELLVDLTGICPTHGRVAVEWSPTLVVVNAGVAELDVLGRYLSREAFGLVVVNEEVEELNVLRRRGIEDVVRYRRDDGEIGFAARDVVDIVDSDEIGGEW